MAGAPAEATLQALKSSGESSLDEAESTADDMSDGEDARRARPNGRRPGGTPLVPCKRVPSGSPSPPPAARRDGRAAALAAALARPRAKDAEAASISDGARRAAASACA